MLMLSFELQSWARLHTYLKWLLALELYQLQAWIPVVCICSQMYHLLSMGFQMLWHLCLELALLFTILDFVLVGALWHSIAKLGSFELVGDSYMLIWFMHTLSLLTLTTVGWFTLELFDTWYFLLPNGFVRFGCMLGYILELHYSYALSLVAVW